MIMISDLSFGTGCETEIQLSFWLFGKNFIIQILTVCNSRRRSEAGLNRFVMTPTKWIEQTNAIVKTR